MAEQLKVVLIGAASPQWGHTISRDLIVMLSDSAICNTYKPVLVMEDIDEANLEIQTRLARIVAEKAGAKVAVKSTTDQKKAIDGARFVVVTFAQGTLEAMQHDIEIPYEYGIFQPVGDTISIGGAIRAARNIPALLSIARDMERYGHGKAWMLNLANPMSILCRAVTRETGINTVGCCHELYGAIRFLSQHLGFDYARWREKLSLDVLGINHCGWIRRVNIDGQDGLEMLRRYLASFGITAETKLLYNSATPQFRRDNVRINLFLRHGVLPVAADRHTVEFFTEFVSRATNKGADYGVLLTSPQERLVEWRGGARARALDMAAGKIPIDLTPSQEAASKIIRAMLLDEPLYDVGNIPYHGSELPGVPDGAVLERMVTYDATGVRPDKAGPLPPAVHKHLVHTAQFIEDIVEASVSGDRALFIEALERDMLLKNMDKGKISEMADRLLAVHRRHVHAAFFKVCI